MTGNTNGGQTVLAFCAGLYGFEQEQHRSLVRLGLNPVGTFQAGCELTAANDIIQDDVTKLWYRWDDLMTLPKVVSADSTPESSGGSSKVPGRWWM